jgi:hypothetical protein
MNYLKSVLVGLSIFVGGFALFRAMIFLLQIARPYLEQMEHNQKAESARGWGISLGPGSSLIFLLLVSALAAFLEYRRLKNKERSVR